jgi:hypothetical protein
MDASDRVLDYIEDTLSSIVKEIQIRPCGKPSITLRRIGRLSSDPSQTQITERDITYSFPGKNKEEAWRFGNLT